MILDISHDLMILDTHKSQDLGYLVKCRHLSIHPISGQGSCILRLKSTSSQLCSLNFGGALNCGSGVCSHYAYGIP